MAKSMRNQRMAWLAAGVCVGMAIAYYCPSEPAYAETAVAGEKFAMCTANTLAGNSEAVFILDMLTGRLLGAAYNTQSGQFTQYYARDLAQDFGLQQAGSFVMVSGTANLRSGAGGPPASGVLYIGELKSGLVNMYAFPYTQSPTPLPPRDLVGVGQFNWRQAVQ